MEQFKNSVGNESLGVGKNNPISLKTNEDCNYRVTGYSQLKDILECGYVRPKPENKPVVYWSSGGNLYYYDKRPVLEVPKTKLQDGQMTPIMLEDLSGIYMFSDKNNKYENRLNDFIKFYKNQEENESENKIAL